MINNNDEQINDIVDNPEDDVIQPTKECLQIAVKYTSQFKANQYNDYVVYAMDDGIIIIEFGLKVPRERILIISPTEIRHQYYANQSIKGTNYDSAESGMKPVDDFILFWKYQNA